MFLKTATTLAIFKSEGKTPVERERLIRDDRGSEMERFSRSRIRLRMLKVQMIFEDREDL